MLDIVHIQHGRRASQEKAGIMQGRLSVSRGVRIAVLLKGIMRRVFEAKWRAAVEQRVYPVGINSSMRWAPPQSSRSDTEALVSTTRECHTP